MLKSCRLHRGKFNGGSLTVKADLATFTILSTAQKKRTRKNHKCIHSLSSIHPQFYVESQLLPNTSTYFKLHIMQFSQNQLYLTILRFNLTLTF